MGNFNEEPENDPINKVIANPIYNQFEDLWSYKDNQIGEPAKKHPFTTFKYCKKNNEWIKRCNDYIFIRKNQYFEDGKITIEKYLDPSDIEKEGILNHSIGNPCPNHPSHHYSIGYQVKLFYPEALLEKNQNNKVSR